MIIIIKPSSLLNHLDRLWSFIVLHTRIRQKFKFPWNFAFLLLIYLDSNMVLMKAVYHDSYLYLSSINSQLCPSQSPTQISSWSPSARLKHYALLKHCFLGRWGPSFFFLSEQNSIVSLTYHLLSSICFKCLV